MKMINKILAFAHNVWARYVNVESLETGKKNAGELDIYMHCMCLVATCQFIIIVRLLELVLLKFQ